MDRRILSLEQTHLYLEVVEAALQINRHAQFFPFLQGCLQYLMPHDILICGYETAPGACRFASYSVLRYFDDQQLAAATAPEGLVQRLLLAWQEVRRPIIVSPDQAPGDYGNYCVPFAEPPASLQQSELHHLLAHGMSGPDGRIDSFFCFARLPQPPESEQSCMLQWLIPHLHAAFMRSRSAVPRRRPEMPLAVSPPMVTGRELEILHWVNLGKTNWEIAKILDISPLTVKNHVQNIFRKLNVQTRRHAALKANEIGLLKAQLKLPEG